MEATLSHDGLTDRERERLAEWNSVWEAVAKYPEGSAMRAMLERRMATLEIELGL